MKTLKIVLIVIVILVVAIWLLKLLNNDKKGVEISYVKVDTVYVESNKRDSIAKLIDTIFINNANNTKKKKNYIKLLSIVIVLLLFGSSLSCAQSQSEDRLKQMESEVDSLVSHSFTGVDSISLNKDIIKIANAKLILSNEYKSQYESFKAAYELKVQDCIFADSIIARQKFEIRRISTVANNAIDSLNDEQKKSKKYKKQRNVAIGFGTIITIVAAMLIK